ncbi:2-keto-4-pentenoate hydratase [Fictibacillus gelatini]|uniref:2-keto-4-pentenoate hydratase n=1 Tax=Fictibacillus gelatini TaxID=225985 RepID=UPI00040C52EF|nr:fumarylacetoacetate hydrolase family protein [Fictibacillus gelatini]
MPSIIEELAEELLKAELSKQPIDPLTTRYRELTADDAYRIQLEAVKRRLKDGRKVIGKKVGLTSKAMQKMLNVDEPDYGHLFDDMKVKSGETVQMNSMIMPKVEAEIGFILGADLFKPNVTFIDVMMATEFLVPTLEIIDSRISDWNIKLEDTVADNGSSAKVVIGEQRREMAALDLRSTSMVLLKNGDVAATGAGAAALGHPAHAVAWLANKLYEYDIPLKAGELILPGALSGAIEVAAGDTITAQFGSLGSVSVSFE